MRGLPSCAESNQLLTVEILRISEPASSLWLRQLVPRPRLRDRVPVVFRISSL